MRTRAGTLAVSSLLVASVGLLGLQLVFAFAVRGSAVPENLATEADTIEFSLAVVAFVIVGALVASRRPRNPIGWILIAEGLLWQAMPVLAGYTGYALFVQPDRLPAGRVAAWLLEWAWILPIGLVPFFFLLFPDGRLGGRRWRPVAWLAVCVPVLVIAGDAFAPGPLQAVPSVTNPVGIAGAQALAAVAVFAEGVLLAVVFVASIVRFGLRFRASRGVERQQFKWLAYATVVLAASLLAAEILSALGVPDDVTSNFNVLPLLGLPVAVGVAILSYQLYDIDRIINRTLVYGVLTALLSAIYATGVLLLPQLIGSTSPLFAAGSTLVAAALFQPLRRPLQNAVDRRFNRRRYDAAKTIEVFSARLRHHIDLEALTAEMLATVEQTVEPTHVSLWLRPATAPAPSTAPAAEPTTTAAV